MTPLDAAAASEANRLYWETEDSVSDIAENLEISRRALYESVEPLPTGDNCEVCGGPLFFENRSARTAGDAACAVCEETGATDDNDTLTEARQPAVRSEGDDHAMIVGGAALAGAAIGALLTFALVHRR
jgi:hypothetical protein